MKYLFPLLAALALAAPAAAQDAGGMAGCKADAQKFCQGVKPGGGRIVRCLKQHQGELSAGCQLGGGKASGAGAAAADGDKSDGDDKASGAQAAAGDDDKSDGDDPSETKSGDGAGDGSAAKPDGDAPAKGPDAAMTACKDDKERFCKDVQEGRGRILKCMAQHKDELSDGCKQAMASMMKGMRDTGDAMKKACGDDIQSLCKDVEPGGRRIVKCLRQHKDELSDGCKTFAQGMRRKFRRHKGSDDGEGGGDAKPAPVKGDDSGDKGDGD